MTGVSVRTVASCGRQFARLRPQWLLPPIFVTRFGSITCISRCLTEGSVSSSHSTSQAAEAAAVSGGGTGNTLTGGSATAGGKDYGGLDFKIIWDAKTGPARTIHLVAPTMQEKAAWISDISQVSARASACVP